MDNDKQFVFGIHPVVEILKVSPGEVEEILLAVGADRSGFRLIDAAARRVGVRVKHVHPKLLDRLARGQRHQGVLARVQARGVLPFAQLFETLASSRGPRWILILDGLTDPRNFGALLRTAEAVGVEHVLIPKDRSVGVTSTVAKTSAGAVHHLKIYQATNLRRAIATLKTHGLWMIGLDAQSRVSIYDQVYPEKLGIIIGSEGKGIRPLILRECDFLVSIPMLGKIPSLNVAVAGAVFLYELVRNKLNVDKAVAKG